jgi:hypothetical protein
MPILLLLLSIPVIVTGSVLGYFGSNVNVQGQLKTAPKQKVVLRAGLYNDPSTFLN